MTTKDAFEGTDTDRIVYVRAVDTVDLPQDIQDQIGSAGQVYAVHRADGSRLALVKDRQLAFALARKNDLAPVTVH
ncbi:MAG: DUF1150 family protein [Paracoccaceae bacterium]|mgnify:CR=1 FL=1